jgi:hypothetical protein
MADKHILSLEVPTVSNREIFSVRDTSQYSSNLDIDCSELLITSPGYNVPVLIEVDPDFNLHLNACQLAVQTENCGTVRTNLRDGIYVIRYSVAPVEKVYVEYNHLRVTSLLTLYYETLCHIDVKDCEPHSERKELIDEMKYIRTLIDAAVAKVEYCNSPEEGISLYDYAKKRLQKISCKTAGC